MGLANTKTIGSGAHLAGAIPAPSNAIKLAAHVAKCHAPQVNSIWKKRLHRVVERARPALPYLPAVLVTAWIAHKAVSNILERAGHPAVPLDDAYIHFQYARNLANGQFFNYAPGQGYVAGATSLLWPLLMAPFYLIGFRDLSIIWIAWLFGFAAFAALLVEVFRLASKLTGTAVALSASAMCALFGAFIWFAASGMETIPLSWALVRTARLASEWCEASPDQRTRHRRTELLVFAILTPLLRPEGALASVFVAATLIGIPSPAIAPKWKARLLGASALLGPLITPFIHLVMTGSAASNTTTVKWLPVNPYYPTLSSLWEQVGQNLSVFFSTLLDGQQWSAVFLPEGSLPFALMALIAIPVAGWRSSKPWRSVFVMGIALSILVPCTYHTFLWNRLRYLWPFAPAWFIGAACFARLAGDVVALVRPRWAVVTPVLGGVAAGALVGNLKWTLSDLSKSSAAIDLQQVALGRWARENLPQDAIIGVNDTGAIAYFSERTTFDVCGLTTQGEAKYWVAGSGSRFEHYERLYAATPERFPTHFIVYPQWMQCEPVLGKRLHEASVYDQTILGGVTMVVYEARVDLLGSGARPIQLPLTGDLIDEVDVADLESENQHAYEIEHGAGREVSNKVHSDFVFSSIDDDDGKVFDDEVVNVRDDDAVNVRDDDTANVRDDDAGKALDSNDGEPGIADKAARSGEKTWADGGRFYRSADRFVAHLRPGVATLAVARWVGPNEGEVELVVESGSHVLASIRLGAYRAQEVAFSIPAEVAAEQTPIQVRALSGGTFGSLHYWFAVDRAP